MWFQRGFVGKHMVELLDDAIAAGQWEPGWHTSHLQGGGGVSTESVGRPLGELLVTASKSTAGTLDLQKRGSDGFKEYVDRHTAGVAGNLEHGGTQALQEKGRAVLRGSVAKPLSELLVAATLKLSHAMLIKLESSSQLGRHSDSLAGP